MILAWASPFNQHRDILAMYRFLCEYWQKQLNVSKNKTGMLRFFAYPQICFLLVLIYVQFYFFLSNVIL